MGEMGGVSTGCMSLNALTYGGAAILAIKLWRARRPILRL